MNNQITTETSKNVASQPHHHFMNNLFNIFGFHQHHDLTTLAPKIEVTENKNNVAVSAELPGIEENDIDLEISSNGYLTISGEKRHEDATTSHNGYFSEMTYGSFSRTIPLPWDLEYSKATAEYTNGILNVSIPKSKSEQNANQKINLTNKKKAKAKTKIKR